jgi:hypothetical protein
LAVNTVTAAGALYFSSAANSGNKTQTQSGTYEGDFVASALAIPAAITTAVTNVRGLPPGGLSLHQFPSGQNFTVLTGDTDVISLKWSDQLGHSANDYDIIVTNSGGTAVVCTWTGDPQTGTQDPVDFAFCNTGTFVSNGGASPRIYVVKYGSAAVARALRIDTNRGRITAGDSTAGSTFGHNAAATALTAAAIDVRPIGGGVFTGGTGVHVNFYSSDGPRKIFYTPTGTVITPGNFLFGTGGGTTLAKADLTASDCGATATTGFITFCGTSAAAPTAASIAALIKSAKSSLTKAQITTALLTSALDIEATAGADRDSGVGIVMADAAVRSVLTLTTAKSFAPPSIVSGTTSVLTIQLTNTNSRALTGVSFTDTYAAGVVNAASPSASVSGAGCVATLAATAGGGSIGVTAATLPVGTMCAYTVTVTSSVVGSHPDASGTVTNPIAFNTALPSATLTVTAVAGSPPVVTGIVARKVHGSVGTFDLPLTFTTPPTVNHAPTTEPRQGPAHQIVFTYDKPLNAATATVTEGTATPSSSIVGSTVVVNLAGVTNQQYVTVSLTGVGSTDGGTGGVGAARVGFLAGDVNASRTVSVADVGLVNAVLAQAVNASNYLKDVNFSGTLSVADKAIANLNLTKALAAP